MDSWLETFSNTSLTWAMGLILVIGLIYGIRAVLGYKSVARDAVDDFQFKATQDMVPVGLSEDGYVRAYKRFNNPRALLYISGVMLAIAVFTLPAMGLLNGLTILLWELGGRDEAFTPGFLVHALLMFFLTIFFWAFLAYMAARHYHSRTPLSFKDELKRELD